MFLETLDGLKFLLTDTRFLGHFKDIPKYVEFSQDPQDELNVSYMQVLALLSFNPDNHAAMEEYSIISKLLRSGLFKIVILTLRSE